MASVCAGWGTHSSQTAASGSNQDSDLSLMNEQSGELGELYLMLGGTLS